MKLYKNSDGEWVLGLDVIPPGSCMKDIDPDGTIGIVNIYNGRIYSTNLKPTDYEKENGDKYASLAEFTAATKAFFFRLRDLKTNAIELSAEADNEKPFIVRDKDGNIVAFIDSNGFKEIRYRDEYVGGPWLVPAGVAAPDVVSAVIGGVTTQCYTFDGGVTEERLSNSFEIAHDLSIDEINEGTLKIEWHNHFRPSTNNAGDVKFFFDWSYSPPNAAPIAMTSLSFVHTIAANKQLHHLIKGVELPVPLGGFAIGGIIDFTLRRTPADAADTYADDILLIKAALHVPTNDYGSRQRYVK